jgi:hypothetical protein
MFRSSTIIRELLLSVAKVMLEHLCPYRLCGSVAACVNSNANFKLSPSLINSAFVGE